jgi:hypothetical protein
MGKLKQYEIDAIVSTITRQVNEAIEAKDKTRFSKANTEMEKLEAAIDALEKKVEVAKEARDKRGEKLAKELGEDVRYSSWMEGFSTTRTSDFISIRNEVIINQLDLTSDVDAFIKKIVEKYSK